MQTRLFESSVGAENLENQINDWLIEQDGVTIRDIRLATCGIWCGDSLAIIRTALVLYDYAN